LFSSALLAFDYPTDPLDHLNAAEMPQPNCYPKVVTTNGVTRRTVLCRRPDLSPRTIYSEMTNRPDATGRRSININNDIGIHDESGGSRNKMFSTQNIYENRRGGVELGRPVNQQEQKRAKTGDRLKDTDNEEEYNEEDEEEAEEDEEEDDYDLKSRISRRFETGNIPFLQPFMDRFKAMSDKFKPKTPDDKQPEKSGFPNMPMRRSQTLNQPTTASRENSPQLMPNLEFVELSAAERQQMYDGLEENIAKINAFRCQLQQASGKTPSRRTMMGIFGLMTHSLHHAVNAAIGGDADVNAYADSDIGVGPAAKTRTFADIKPNGHIGAHGSGHGEIRGDIYDDRYYEDLNGRVYMQGDGSYGTDRYIYDDRLRPRYDYEYRYDDRNGYGPASSGYGVGRKNPNKVENKIIIQHAERRP
jgi:hypothetical protein